MRLRSLHLDAGRSWRGGQRQVLLLAHELRERGHEPLVLGAPDAPLVQRAHASGLATAAISMRSDWDLRAVNRLRALVRTWRPDIVHAHDARTHAIALLALTGRDTPLIVTRRVTFPPKSVRLKYGTRVTRFIAISHAVKAAMASAGIDPDRIDVVHSGVPTPVALTPRDWRDELGWPGDSVVVGVVGAMTAEKGTDSVTGITHSLTPDQARRTRIVMLGGEAAGPTEFGAVEAYRAGFVTDIYNAMAGLDLLWHPAASEGLGTAIIDALALKVPPVAFAVGGIPEIIQDGVQGRLAAPGDVRGFAEAHGTMLEAENRDRFAEAGPARAAIFSVEAMTDSIERVYQRVLNA